MAQRSTANRKKPGAAPSKGRPSGASSRPEVSNEVHLDAKYPVPFEDAGWSSWDGEGREYIPFINTQHNYMEKILEARLLSVTQGACINTKTSYTVGEGLAVTNLKEGQAEDAVLKQWRESCNGRRQSLNEVMRQVIESFYATGNVPIEIVRGKAGGKPFVYIYRRNILDCRLAAVPAGKSDSEAMIISRSFRRHNIFTISDDAKKAIPLYNVARANRSQNWVKDGNVERTAIWLKNDMAGFDHYGMPSSIASLIFQLLEHGGARYNLDNLENNMVVATILTLTGNVNQAEASRIGKTIIKQHTGVGKRGRTAVVASEQGISDSKLHNLNTHTDGSYKEMMEQAESKILLANEWDAVLAGLQSSSSLGKGAGYLQEIYDQKYEIVIRPVIQKIREQLLKPLITICDEWLGTKWSQYNLDFLPAQISTKHGEASTTVNGIKAFLDIVKLVASGAYPLDAAVAMVQRTYGLSEAEARAQLGNIQIIGPDVLKKSTDA